MATHQVFIKPSADKALHKLSATTRQRILAAVEKLADNPRPAGAKKMVEQDIVWRIRIGRYRVLYEIHDDQLIVLVVKIGPRKDIYRK